MSKNTKTVLFRFMPYECTALEEFLEKEASKGWMITEIKGSFIKFKRTEPKTLKFTVDMINDITLFDNEDNEVSLNYREYCEEAGWQYVCSKGKIHIFYTENYLESIPIHTDPKEKFKQIVKSSTWTILSFATIIILWMTLLYQWSVDPGMIKSVVSSNIMIISVSIYIEIISFYLVEIISFVKWIIKSKKSLRENKFIPYNSYKNLKNKNVLYKAQAVLGIIFIFTLPIIDNSSVGVSVWYALISLLIVSIILTNCKMKLN